LNSKIFLMSSACFFQEELLSPFSRAMADERGAARRGGRGRAGEGAPGARRGGRGRRSGAGMPGAGREAPGCRRASSSAVSSFALAAAVPLWLFSPLVLGTDFLPPPLAVSEPPPASLTFLLSCLPPAPAPPPAPLPPPRLLPRAPRPPRAPRHLPATSPPPARPPSGMSCSPPQERRDLGVGAPRSPGRPCALESRGGQVRGPGRCRELGCAGEPWRPGTSITKPRLGAPGLSLLGREGAPLRGAPKPGRGGGARRPDAGRTGRGARR
jgi:hypothetical protein